MDNSNRVITILIVIILFSTIPIITIGENIKIQIDRDNYENNNSPPEKPTFVGPNIGVLNVTYNFTACTTDPDGDKIYYHFDWGDGCAFTKACCYCSGRPCTTCHCYESTGLYIAKVCAMDEYCHYSEWSDPIIVAMSKNYNSIIKNTIFTYFMEILYKFY